MTDVARVRKIYKLNVGGGGKEKGMNGVVGEEGKGEGGLSEIELGVLGAMALRSVTN